MSNIPADGANQEQKIQYIKENFGRELAKDLLTAAESGKMPRVLHDFLLGNIDGGKISTENNEHGNSISIILNRHEFLTQQRTPYNNKTQKIDTASFLSDNCHHVLEQAVLTAIEKGNNDFLRAFQERTEPSLPKDRTSALAMLIDSSNDKAHKFP